LTLLLCAGAASAQVTPIRFAAPISPIAGLPKLLPSPLTGPLVGTGISLPTPLPTLAPSVILAPAFAAAAIPAAVAEPAALPSRGGQLTATSDGVVNPLTRVMPGVAIRFAGAETPSKPASVLPDSSKQKLDETFDGGNRPSKPSVVPGRKPVTSGRHISLPEWDLERELGI
jgi:hypothetical protein